MLHVCTVNRIFFSTLCCCFPRPFLPPTHLFICAQVQLVLLQWVAWFLRMKRPGENDDPGRPPCAPHLRRCSSGSQSGSIPNPTDPTFHPLHPQNLAPLQTGPLHAGHPHLHTQSSANNNGNLLYMGFQSMEEPTVLSEHVQRNNISAGSVRVSGSPPPHLPSQFCSSPPPTTPNMDTVCCPSTVSSGGGFGGAAGGCSTAGIGDPQLQAILEEVRFMADRFREQDESERVADQWKFAGAVIDRLCLVAFSVFNIICTISILMSAPNFVDAISKDFVWKQWMEEVDELRMTDGLGFENTISDEPWALWFGCEKNWKIEKQKTCVFFSSIFCYCKWNVRLKRWGRGIQSDDKIRMRNSRGLWKITNMVKWILVHFKTFPLN